MTERERSESPWLRRRVPAVALVALIALAGVVGSGCGSSDNSVSEQAETALTEGQEALNKGVNEAQKALHEHEGGKKINEAEKKAEEALEEGQEKGNEAIEEAEKQVEEYSP